MRPPLTVDDIVDAAVWATGIDPRGPSHTRISVAVRRAVVFLARRHTPASFPELARAMRASNHSSVVDQYQAAAGLLAAGAAPGVPREWHCRWPNFAALVDAIADKAGLPRVSAPPQPASSPDTAPPHFAPACVLAAECRAWRRRYPDVGPSDLPELTVTDLSGGAGTRTETHP